MSILLDFKRGVTFNVYERAREMLSAGYDGQNLSEAKRDLIFVAAVNPYVEHEMTSSLYGVWYHINARFEGWKAREQWEHQQCGEAS